MGMPAIVVVGMTRAGKTRGITHDTGVILITVAGRGAC